MAKVFEHEAFMQWWWSLVKFWISIISILFSSNLPWHFELSVKREPNDSTTPPSVQGCQGGRPIQLGPLRTFYRTFRDVLIVPPCVPSNSPSKIPYMLVLDILVFILALSLFILRDLPQQKIPRELWGGGDPAIFLCSHVPLKRFFWWDRSGKFKNTRRKEWKKEKEEIYFIFYIHGGSHTHVFSISQECPWAIALVQLSLRRTHSYDPPLQLVIIPSTPCHPS